MIFCPRGREWFRQQGRKGGKRRIETLTQAQRTAIARKAARVRWAKKKSR